MKFSSLVKFLVIQHDHHKGDIVEIAVVNPLTPKLHSIDEYNCLVLDRVKSIQSHSQGVNGLNLAQRPVKTKPLLLPVQKIARRQNTLQKEYHIPSGSMSQLNLLEDFVY